MASLFDEVTLGKNLTLKNRLAMTPMGIPSLNPDGSYSERQIDFYEQRAKGGFGLVFPACAVVTTDHENNPPPNVLKHYTQSVRVGMLADRIHRYGGKLAIQLSCGLGRVFSGSPNISPKTPSRTESYWFKGVYTTPFTKEEIHKLVADYGWAAWLAQHAGADAIEIHGYGGYLIDQFISDAWNQRTDEYGGSFENRFRIVREILAEIRKQCGPDYPVFFKMTPEYCWKIGGRTLDEGIRIAQELDKMGFALLHIEQGTYECWHRSVPTIYQEEGYNLYMAKALKEAGIKTPIMAQGKLHRPEFAKQVAESGYVDIIGLGHQCFADPEWPNKVKEGREDEIIPCIGCNECINCGTNKRNMRCAVNPYAVDERNNQLPPRTRDMKVLVVGGGPGGVEAALIAKERGFDVELWEKTDKLGGIFRAAGVPNFKHEIPWYIEAITRRLERSGVPIKYNTEATTENILEYAPDAVIMAYGAKPIIPRIPGIDNPKVIPAPTMLLNGGCEGQKVVVLGAGDVGLEAAMYLRQQNKDVTIVEMMDGILGTSTLAPNQKLALRELYSGYEEGITHKFGSTLSEVGEDTLTIVAKDGSVEKIEYDALVLAIGFAPDKTLARSLVGKVEKVICIGNTLKQGMVIDAVHGGFHAARLLEDLRDILV